MAEQQVISKRELEELQRRQESVLNKISQLTNRLSTIQRENGVPYDTSNVKPLSLDELNKKQSSIFERLLNIAGAIDKIATKQNIQLPAQDEVADVIQTVSKDLEERQKKSIAQLQGLTEMAKSITEIVMPEIKKLINDKEEKDENKDDEKKMSVESVKKNKFKERRFDLELVAECLKKQCIRIDNNDSGKC
eukprot:108128_1